MKCGDDRASEQLARHSKVTLDLVRKMKWYRTLMLSRTTIKVILSSSTNISFIPTSDSSSNPKASEFSIQFSIEFGWVDGHLDVDRLDFVQRSLGLLPRRSPGSFRDSGW